MIIGNTKYITLDDMTSLADIPAWMTDYVQLNASGQLEAKASGSPLEIEPEKMVFFYDINDAKVYMVEIPEGTPTECQTI